MSIRAHIRRIISWIERRRRQAEIRRGFPSFRGLDRRIEANTRAHKPTAHLKNVKRDRLHAALARGLR